MQTVNISCSGRHRVILVRRARYGRMQLGRCVQRDLGYIGCNSDVLPLLDQRCSARRRCAFSLPDTELYATQPCPVDTTSYLEVTHECLQGSLAFCVIIITTRCAGGRHNMPPPRCKLTFDLLTLKVVSESRVTWATSVPILVFLGLSVRDLGPMHATDRRQTSSDVVIA